jgi:hypothetical protein
MNGLALIFVLASHHANGVPMSNRIKVVIEASLAVKNNGPGSGNILLLNN